MKLSPHAEASLAAHLPRLLSRARALLQLPGADGLSLGQTELKRAARIVSELHEGLVGERRLARASTYQRAAFLGAYLLWWWPQSYARARAALSLAPLPLEPSSSAAASVRILDLGAGPGPAALAVADELLARGHRVEALLVDESEAALQEARALADGRAGLSLRTERVDLASPAALARFAADGARAFEVISAAHLLSELPGAARERAHFLRAICAAHLAPRGALVLLEPALRETGRALLEVRDLLLGALEEPALDEASMRANPLPERLSALAPCLTQARCPALANARDWCTAEVSWRAPPHLLQLSRELGLHAEAPLSFAPMLLARETPKAPADVWRVVGVPAEEKGKKRLFVCAGPGRVPVSRLDRDAGESTRAFDEACRGDLLRLQGMTPKGDGLRLGAGASAEPVNLDAREREPARATAEDAPRPA